MRDICLISRDAGHLMKMRDGPAECGTVDTYVAVVDYWLCLSVYLCVLAITEPSSNAESQPQWKELSFFTIHVDVLPFGIRMAISSSCKTTCIVYRPTHVPKKLKENARIHVRNVTYGAKCALWVWLHVMLSVDAQITLNCCCQVCI